MAVIPLSSPAQRVIAQPEQDSYAPAGAFDTGASALGQVAGALGEIGAAGFAQARYQDHLGKLQAKASAAAALADHENQVKTLTQDMSEDIASGRLDWKAAADKFHDGASLIEVPKIDGLVGPDAENYQKGISNNLAGGTRVVGKAAFAGQVAQTKGIVGSTLDALGKQAGMPNTDVDQVAGRLDSMDEVGRIAYGDAWDAKKQTAKDGMFFDATTQRFNASRDSLDGLGKLKEDLTSGPTSMKVDSNKRNELLGKIEIRQGQLQSKLEHDSSAMDAIGERAAKEAQDQAASGKPFDDAQLANITARVKGTQYEAMLPGYVKEVADTQALLRLSPAEQQAEVQRQQTWLTQKGGDLELQARVARTATAVEKNLESMKKQPLIWAQDRTGTPAQAVDFGKLTDPASVASIGQEFSRRLGTITAMQKKYGSEIAMAPLLPQEADQLGATVAKVPDTAKLQLFGVLAKAMPADAFAGAMHQLKLDGPSTAAGFAEARNLKTSLGNSVGATLLEGAAILKDKSAVFPKTHGDAKIPDGEDALLPYFNTHVGDAIPMGAAGREEAFQVFRAAYMGAGKHLGTLTGTIDTDTAHGALNIATGGVTTVNKHQVVKPWGMEDDAFSDKLDAALRTAAPTTKFGYDDLRKLPLQGTRVEGEYRVLMGRGFIPGADGKPLIMKVQ